MPNAHSTLSSLFTDIADAIREVMSETKTIIADEFPDYIRKLTYVEPPTLLPTSTWYKGTTDRNNFTAIRIVNKYTPTGSETESWDASVAQDGGIKCYVSGTTLIISGNGSGRIKTNENSNYAFSDPSYTKTFRSVTAFSGIELLDTRNTKYMGWMFANLSKLTTLNLSTFNTSEVIGMSNMFLHCDELTDLDVSGWDVSKVTVMEWTWSQCYKLQNLNMAGWSQTLALINAPGLFESCNKLTSVDLSSFVTTKLTILNSMFYNCGSLTTLDLSSFDTSNVTGMENTFAFCNNLKTIYVSDKWSTAKVTRSNGMFQNDTNLRGDIDYNSSYVDKTYAKTTGGYLTYKAAPAA